MTRGTVVALVSLWVHLAAAHPLPAQVAVQDLEVHLQLKRDAASLTQVIPVRNEEQRTQQVRVTLGDWIRDSLGNNVFTERTDPTTDCGPKLRVFPTTFQVAPGATELVRVTYAPTTEDDGCWAVAFIETVAPPAARPESPGSYLSLEIRTGVKIYVHRADAHRAGVVETADVGLVWRPKESAPGRRDSVEVREASVLLVNTGTAHLRVNSTLEIRDAQARLLHSLEGAEAPMTPGSARYIPIRMPALPPGEYVAVVLLDYGGDEIAAAQVEFRVP